MKEPSRNLALFVLGALTLVVACAAALPARAGDHSALWGKAGERWNERSRLPDFSYAGYCRGEQPLPQRPREVTVVDFGARGDDEKDDTGAFRRALAESRGKVVVVPRGRYIITDFVDIRSSRTVLRGADDGGSVLFFPTPLNEIEPNWGATTSGRKTSNYSWSGGFLRIVGSLSRKRLASVTEPARRGDRALVLSSVEGLAPGGDYRLEVRDTPEGTLARHLYAGDPGPIDNLRGRARQSFSFRISRIDAERRRIEFDRPLRTDVDLDWKPALHAAASSVEESGIERLVFEFPVTPYGGHFTEVGYNAIALSGVRNCWVRDIRIRSADSGIFVRGLNNTLERIVIESDREPERSRKGTGHHGVTLGGQDNLLVDFDIRTRFMHDITVTSGSAGNVVARGRGVDLCFDHHRYGPHSNLFTDVDLGEGSRMFQSGGGAKLGRHSAAYETFWGIRARRPQSWPAAWGPDLMNLVGLPSDGNSVTSESGRWFEAIPPEKLRPRNLYAAQLGRRRGAE